MTATPLRLRVDEQAIGAGTTVRFALLVVLLLVSSAWMILGVIEGLSGSNDEDGFGCAFAAGADPLHTSELVANSQVMQQNSAYEACLAKYEAPPSSLLTLGWPILVLALAIALFWGLARWKGRYGRVIPLARIDRNGTISAQLGQLGRSVAGLDRLPRFVVDPAAASTGAVVFGSNRRPVVCLHGGLLVRRSTDPDRFDAVVLHELAHVRNGDITVTYLTVAVWRVFLVLVLLPYLYWTIHAIAIGMHLVDWPVQAPNLTKNFALMALMVVLIYLARSDVLRSREIYADLTAASWGADHHGWTVAPVEQPGGRLRLLGASFVELWRTHPRQELRRASLSDPATLFGVQALPMFLTGAVAALVNDEAVNFIGYYVQTSSWPDELVAGGVAVLVAAVAGVMLWRAAAHSVLTGRTGPSGVVAGLWLGAGMAAAELVVEDLATFQWLPSQPEVLLIMIGAGVVFCWWSTRCAHLWLRAWPGRTVRLAVLLGLAAGCVVLAGWFEWWSYNGSEYANGYFALSLTPQWTGPGNDPLTVAAANLIDLTDGKLVQLAVAALWVAPLLVWLADPITVLPRWSRAVRRGTGDTVSLVSGVPPLRRVLLAALLGGIFGWLALAVAMAWLHATSPPPVADSTYQQVSVFMVVVLVTWIAGMVVAAAIAGALAGRWALLAALIAAAIAQLIAFVGMFPLAALDGCVPALATLRSSCAWRPGMTWPTFSFVIQPVLVLGVLAAIVVAAIVAGLRRLRGAGVWPFAGVAPLPTRTIARFGVLALAALTLGIMIVCEASQPRNSTSTSDTSTVSAEVVAQPVSPQVRTYQLGAWVQHGGDDLMTRFDNEAYTYIDLLAKHNGEIHVSRLRAFCATFDQILRDANDYFVIPDTQAQSLWRTFLAQLTAAGQDCDGAVAHSNGDLLTKSAQSVTDADTTVLSVQDRIVAAERAGGA